MSLGHELLINCFKFSNNGSKIVRGFKKSFEIFLNVMYFSLPYGFKSFANVYSSLLYILM